MQLSDSHVLKGRKSRASDEGTSGRPEYAPEVATEVQPSNSSSGPPPCEAVRPTCLLTTCYPERALSRALIQHLRDEMPDTTFTLRAADNVSAVWVCGYEPGSDDLIRLIRSRYPEALLLVTGRGDPGPWSAEVHTAGADFAASWPIPYDRLSRLLNGRRRAV